MMIKIYSSSAVDPGTLFAIGQPPCHVTVGSELSVSLKSGSTRQLKYIEYALSTLQSPVSMFTTWLHVIVVRGLIRHVLNA